MGRDFETRDLDTRDKVHPRYRSVVINASFARRYFGEASPLGHRIGFGARPDTKTDVVIVGVVADFSYRGIREETDQAFFPFLDIPWSGGTFYVRTQGRPENAFPTIRATVARLDPTLPVLSLRTIGNQIDRSLTTERMMATLLAGFSAVALLLAVASTAMRLVTECADAPSGASVKRRVAGGSRRAGHDRQRDDDCVLGA